MESDDLFLHDQVDVVWFDVLNSLDYHKFQVTAAHYTCERSQCAAGSASW